MSDREVAAVRAFLQTNASASAGRTVLTDGTPNCFDEHGTLRDTNELTALFPPALSSAASYAAAAGKTHARAGDITEYGRTRLQAKADPAWATWIQEQTKAVPREVALSPEQRVRVHRYKLGNARLLAFERNIDYQMSEDLKQAGGNQELEKPVQVNASLAVPAHLYDLRRGVASNQHFCSFPSLISGSCRIVPRSKMKAAVLHGAQDVRIEEVPELPLRPGEVRIGIEASLTCGTDLKVFKRGYHAKMIVPPAVFGHELSGCIREVGPEVTGWKVGDRVVVANSAPCGTCFHCREDQEFLCDDLLFLNGAYAESIVVPRRLVEKNLLRLKPETSYLDAALVEPLACVVQGVVDSRLSPGRRVLVIGAGPIVLMFVALAKHLGCEVFVAGRGERRLKVARQLGATKVIDIAGREVGEAKYELGPAPDVVIEAVGHPGVWEAAFHLVRKGGLVNFFGGCPAGTTVTLDTSRIHYSSITMLASFHHTPRTIRRALELIEAGVVRASDFVDGECPLSRLPALFHEMAGGNRMVKTLVRVNA
jgi:L-iditol 2-dehydrogenase